MVWFKSNWFQAFKYVASFELSISLLSCFSLKKKKRKPFTCVFGNEVCIFLQEWLCVLKLDCRILFVG